MATEARIHTAIDTIVTRVAAATGSSYHYDLSATNRVRRGVPIEGPTESPEVWIGASAIFLEEETGQAVFGRTRYRVEIPVRCFIAVADADRLTALANLVSDVKRAITTDDRAIGGLGWAVEVGRASLSDGREQGYDAHSIADFSVTFVLDCDDEMI